MQSLSDISVLDGRVSTVNIKLDKWGGLTESFVKVRAAQALGLDTMAGNMLVTSLVMAPGVLLVKSANTWSSMLQSIS